MVLYITHPGFPHESFCSGGPGTSSVQGDQSCPDTVDRDPSVSKSNRLQVDIFIFFFIDSMSILQIPLT